MFYRSTGLPTLIFTNGDHSKGIDIKNGGLRLSNGGGKGCSSLYLMIAPF